MQYLWISYLAHEEDDPTESYVELGADRREQRRIDIYDNGMSFAYGGSRGQEEVLSPAVYPENPVTLSSVGLREVRLLSGRDFEQLWGRIQEAPDGFMSAVF